MRISHGAPRMLLRRLREAMLEPVSAQVRLDKIVTLIAANMVAEVCSLYVMRADGVMELYATEGLKREAVHVTTMRPGEGLVGLVAAEAQPVNLSDARAHPAFAYKPETGEELYNSFLGVPVLRAGNTLGVLVVQNRASRTYSEDEVEALQTTAMVLAETIASGELKSISQAGAEIAARKPLQLEGSILAEGVGLGHAVLHDPRVVVKKLLSDDPQAEIDRLAEAMERLRAQIDALLESGEVAHHGEHRDVLETYRMFAYDDGWLRKIREAVGSGLTAEAAVEQVQSNTRARMLRQTDPYLRERLHDLDELANRLLATLLGENFGARPEALPDNAILVARSMGPAALLDYDRSRLRGLVLEEGGPTSHIAIVARALGIPAIGEVDGVTSLVENGDAIIVDGVAGLAQVRPQPDVQKAYQEKARLRARRQEQYRKLRDLPTMSRDGVAVALNINAGLLVDMPHLDETNAAGVGLFRTELQFMLAPKLPTAAQQQKLYERIFEAAGDRQVVFRTLDIGGDKVLPYFDQIEEENPALGWRAIRIGLDRPALFRSQVRAMLRAGAGRTLAIMLPMIATIAEYDRARTLVLRERQLLANHGHGAPAALKLGVMLEVPSLLFQLDELMPRVDFLSIGSNDLMQFMFAADRENPRVAARFDPLSAPALRVLKMIADAAERAGKPATICGEIGGRPLEAMTLIALGFRSLSMSPAAIGPVKQMLLSLDVAAIRDAILPMLDLGSCKASLRADIAALARARGVAI